MASDLLPTLTFGAGVVGTLAAQAWRERWIAGREREARTAEREVARDAFQRETLLELQEAILRVVRSSSQLRLHHRRVYAQKGTYAQGSEPPGLSEENREAMANATHLRQRVLDDDLREHVRVVQRLCADMTAPLQLTGESDEEAAGRADAQSIQLAHEVNDLEERLGKVLRTLL
jgi:hypothetical protein